MTRNNILQSFSLRLTLWYTALFVASLTIIFVISYQILAADLLHVVDRGLLAATTKIDEEFSKDPFEAIKNDIRRRSRFPEAREHLGEDYVQAAMREVETLKSHGGDAKKELEDLTNDIKEAAQKI